MYVFSHSHIHSLSHAHIHIHTHTHTHLSPSAPWPFSPPDRECCALVCSVPQPHLSHTHAHTHVSRSPVSLTHAHTHVPQPHLYHTHTQPADPAAGSDAPLRLEGGSTRAALGGRVAPRERSLLKGRTNLHRGLPQRIPEWVSEPSPTTPPPLRSRKLSAPGQGVPTLRPVGPGGGTSVPALSAGRKRTPAESCP